MEFFGNLSVNPEIPSKIKGLEDLAYNLWWTWNQDVEDLYRDIDSELWQDVEKNPVEFLAKVHYQDLKSVIKDEEYISRYEKIMSRFNDYLNSDDTWFSKNHTEFDEEEVIAYFSTEFGFHESLPIYSGGLGVLAGDHCKSASDLGLPLIGVGLLYHNGYFEQRINDEGWQKSVYPDFSFDNLPVTPVMDENGEELIVKVKLAQREVFIKVWQVKVGRVTVYLLDTDIDLNSEEDRNITSQLYGGGQQTRISQEIVLGIGGTRALYKMGYAPAVWHMNEGHSVYLGLERIRNLIKDEGLSFEQAREQVSGDTVFTTHTPVPAGNEIFPFGLKDKYFADYWNEVGLNRYEFMQLGYTNEENAEGFGLTVLALKLANYNNGVSKLHGEVASEMWKDVWPNVPADENPITHITNGIHTLTWLAPEWKELFDEYLASDWRNRLEEREVWDQVRAIPDEKFWEVHKKLKKKLITEIREKDFARRKRYNETENFNLDLFDEDKLTIGFARRFATYKRANLILKDVERLNEICNQEGKEVQFVFAGKAHPADVPGQELIKEIYDISQREDFKGKIIILEDYDMDLARYLVQGVDVWLNNPRRPQEASGTSGQKVAANGGLNFSVLDGWWVEGYNSENGWTIGYESEFSSRQEQDQIDAESLYQTLEEEIVPLYYSNEDKVYSCEWIKWMKETMATNGPDYSTDRMVQDYTNELYYPAFKRGKELRASNFEKAKELLSWKNEIKENWNSIRLSSPQKGNLGGFNVKDNIELNVEVDLGKLDTEDVDVELYLVNEYDETIIRKMEIKEKIKDNHYLYKTNLNLEDSGDYKYTFRVIPKQDELSTKHELGLIKWI